MVEAGDNEIETGDNIDKIGESAWGIIETGDNIDKMGESAWGIDRRNNSIGDVSDRRDMHAENYHLGKNDALAMPVILGQSLLTQTRMTVDAGLLVELKEKSDDIQNLQEEEEKTEDLEFDILSIQYDSMTLKIWTLPISMIAKRPRRIAEEEILQETIAKCAVTKKQAKDEEKKIQKKIEKEQQLKQERQEEYRKYLEREEKARVTDKELTRWEMLNRQKQHEVNKGYYVERVGTKEGPRFTSTAVDYMKRWPMPLVSDSDPESDIEEHGSPRSNFQEITNPGSDPPRPGDTMGFRDEPRKRK
ncbi:hypothetical protein QE152_g3882 [Popillia japonica]|uniref:Uncharacterized protein n=1 Tax=Popillia japonica TaxID=7064 RepID=A0AAW1MYV1_POPJA